MTETSFDVFISYRRERGSAEARLIRNELSKRGLHVFMDVTELKKGYFDDALLNHISSAPNFVLILSPHALDRCGDPDDWLRREIIQAITTKRNIIPVMLKEFNFPSPLDPAIKDLPRHQGVEYSHVFFDAMLERIMESVEADKVERLRLDESKSFTSAAPPKAPPRSGGVSERESSRNVDSEKLKPTHSGGRAQSSGSVDFGGTIDSSPAASHAPTHAVARQRVPSSSLSQSRIVRMMAALFAVVVVVLSWVYFPKPVTNTSNLELTNKTSITVPSGHDSEEHFPSTDSMLDALSWPTGVPGGGSNGNGGLEWPQRFIFSVRDRKTGKLDVRGEWFAPWTRIWNFEGQLSGNQLTFSSIGCERGCDEPFVGLTYRLELHGNRFVGTWGWGTNGGPAWVLLPKSAANRQSSPPSSALEQKQSAGGFEFRLRPCLLSESTVVCDLIVINNSKEQELTLGSEESSRPNEAYDEAGNHYVAEFVVLANDKPGKVGHHLMIPDVQMTARIVFYRVQSDVAKIAVLRVPCFSPGTGNFNVEFRNVSLWQ